MGRLEPVIAVEILLVSLAHNPEEVLPTAWMAVMTTARIAPGAWRIRPLSARLRPGRTLRADGALVEPR